MKSKMNSEAGKINLLMSVSAIALFSIFSMTFASAQTVALANEGGCGLVCKLTALFTVGVQEVVCPNGMIAYWNFDETNGMTAADSAGTNPGTLINNPQWTTDSVAGGALNFEKGYRQSVNAGNSNIFNLGASDWTFSMWVKPENLADYHYFLSKSEASSSIGPYAIGIHNDGGTYKWIFLASYPGAGWAVNNYYADASSNIGVWNHLVITRNGGTLSYYINDYNVFERPITSPLMDNTEDFIIGDLNYPGQNLAFNGKIDEVAVYNRGFSQDDVNTIFGKGQQHLGLCEVTPPQEGVCQSLDVNGDGDITQTDVSILNKLAAKFTWIVSGHADCEQIYINAR